MKVFGIFTTHSYSGGLAIIVAKDKESALEYINSNPKDEEGHSLLWGYDGQTLDSIEEYPLKYLGEKTEPFVLDECSYGE